jgi:hypothetical protein
MGRVVDAIHWDGITPVISLFVVPSAAELPDLAEVWTGDTPRRTRMYRLEDDREAATIRVVYEYDFEFETLPVQLEQDLEPDLGHVEPVVRAAGALTWGFGVVGCGICALIQGCRVRWWPRTCAR